MPYTVYKHITPDGKVYIGATKQEVNRRWQNGIGYKTQPFWKAIEQFGWNNIIHEIVADNLSEEDAHLLEQKTITDLKANNPQYGYNIQIGGNSSNLGLKWSPERHEANIPQLYKKGNVPWNKGRKATEEERKKLSESSYWKGKKQPDEMVARRIAKCSATNKGRKNTIEAKQRMSDARKDKKAVSVYTLENTFLYTFESIRDASKKYNIQPNKISRCCRGLSKTAGGYIWKYAKENEDEVGRMLNERIC